MKLWVLVLVLVTGQAWGLDPREPLTAYGRRMWATEDGLPQNTVHAVAQTPDGFVWVGTEDGLARFDGVAFRVYSPETGLNAASALASGLIEGLSVERDGRLRVRTEAGEAVYRSGRVGRAEEAEIKPFTKAWGLPLPKGLGAVRVVFEDREGALWAGCEGGLARAATGKVEVLSAGSAVLAMMEDREGNLWFGTEADGVGMLHEQRFTSFGAEQGMVGSVVRAVLEDANGGVWVGTDGAGLFYRTLSGRFEAFKGVSSGVVLALTGSANGDVWVGTPIGLHRLRGRKVSMLTARDGLADDYVRSLLVDRHGAVWVGTRHGLTRLEPSGAMTNYTAADGLGSDFVGAMLEARNGDLWIGTAGGLARFEGTKFAGTPVRSAITAMVEAADGTIWLGSSGGGVSRMRAGKVEPVRAGNLPAVVSSVLEDQQERLWIGSRRGVVRVAEKALDDEIARGGGDVSLETYDAADGMGSRECSAGGHPAAMRAGDGTLWFATLRGVSVVDPGRLHENTVAPLVGVERVLVNDREREPILSNQNAKDEAPEVVVPAGQRRVEFGYTGLSFVAPEKVRYKYRLEGFDRDWVDAGTRRTAFYTNLRPGRYVFRVMAANNDGLWSEGAAEIRLRLRPFFWETVWFYLLLIAGAGLVAYLVYAARVRRVEARYAGVMEERGRIAREIHDGLAQGIVSISLQLEVVGRLMGTSVDAARAQLEATKGMVRASLAEARSAIWELREDAGELPVRMGALVHRIARAMGRLEVSGTYRALEAGIEEELLRIAGEAVTNAMQHSGCMMVVVRLVYEVGQLEMTVRDDGRGFDAGAETGRFGVRGMRERAEKMGAVFHLASEKTGTMVRIDLKLKVETSSGREILRNV